MWIKSKVNKIVDLFGIEYYRKNKFTYNVGDICYCKEAPIWCRLVCIKSGLTAENNPDFSFISSDGEIVIDGEVKWKVEDLRSVEVSNSVGTYEIGDILWQYKLKENCLLLDGESVSSFSSIYSELYNFLEENTLIVETQAKYDSNKSLWFYNRDTDIMVKPDFIDKTVWGGKVVSVKEAGVPNITGEVDYGYGYAAVGFTTTYPGKIEGAFTKGESKSYSLTGAAYIGNNLAFNASLSNSIYGNSETVQPPAVSLIPQIVFK